VLSGLFYYIFLFFYQRELSYLRIFEHFVFASIPAVLISTVSPFLPPMTLVGVAATGLLLVVGFVENFQIPKKPLTKLIAGLFMVYVLIWISSSINFYQDKKEFQQKHSPINTKILEEEFGTN